MKIITLPPQLCLISLCAVEAVLNLSWLKLFTGPNSAFIEVQLINDYILSLGVGVSQPQRCQFRCIQKTVCYIRRLCCRSFRYLFQSFSIEYKTLEQHYLIYLKNMSSSAQATQIPIRFVCVHVSSTLLFIVVCNRFSRCLSDHCFRLFR